MRSVSVLMSTRDLTLADVRCCETRGGWSESEGTATFSLVLVRAGVFRLRMDGAEWVADAGGGYFELPGQEIQIAHPGEGGDVCTAMVLSSRLADELGVDRLDPAATIVGPELDRDHRLMVARARHAAGDDLEEPGVEIVDRALRALRGPRSTGRRRRTGAAQARLVDDARTLIAGDYTLGLVDVARAVGASPSHLSRIFRRRTGMGTQALRNRLRAREALERIEQGETNLARLAAELSFADHSHLTRVVGRETGCSPSHWRELLGA